MTPHGYFHWNELMTKDLAASKAFYGETLGWTFEEMPMDNGTTYAVAMVGGTAVAGLFDTSHMGDEAGPETWFAYVSVHDLDAALAAARAKGGSVLREPFDVPQVGRIAIVADPRGVAVGWMTPAS
ncbi:VOC family protein [Salinarimonas chemoclinalis]|uniref:VOC family protein n=1 Tax=Salinarimonas chemoclinalis TaxID=3241599 RepID=UPI003556AA21